MLSHTLIDTDGETLDAVVHWRAQDLARCMALSSYVDYSCRNLGYIAIERTQQAVCVSLRPRAISDIGEVTMLYALAELDRSERHVLRVFDRGWRHVILPNLNALFDEVQRLRAPAPEVENFVCQAVAPDDLAVPQNLRDIIDAWRAGAIDIDRYDDLASHVSRRCDQFMVVRKKDDGEVCFDGRGQGVYAVLGGFGLAPLRDRPLRSTTNQSYVSKAAPSYLRTLERDVPTVEKVDALSYMSGNHTLERLRYWRLLVPQQLGPGAALLLSCSVDDSAIRLRQDRL